MMCKWEYAYTVAYSRLLYEGILLHYVRHFKEYIINKDQICLVLCLGAFCSVSFDLINV